MKPYYRCDKSPDVQVSILQKFCTATDMTLMAILSFGFVALTATIWLHLTPQAQLAVVQALQALASLATIASIAWTFLRGHSTQTVNQMIASNSSFKSLLVILACGMLMGGVSSKSLETLMLFCSNPGALLSTQQTGANFTDSEVPAVEGKASAVQEKIPTVEDYLFAGSNK